MFRRGSDKLDGRKSGLRQLIRIVIFADETGNRKELSMFDQATLVAGVPCRWKLNPSYMHSFGITDNYFIIIEQPLTISVPKVIVARARHDPIINCLKWHENKSVSLSIETKRFYQIVICHLIIN